MIEFSNSSMVSPHNEVAAAEILAAQSGKECFPRPGVAGVRRKRAQQHFVLRIHVPSHVFVRLNNKFCPEVPSFFLADNRMDKQAITQLLFQGFQLDKFMATMDHVARMEAYFFFPAPIFKEPSRLSRCQLIFFMLS